MHGQDLVHGIVIDKNSKQPLAFANLAIKNSSTKTSSDIDGKFSFITNTDTTGIICSYVGYTTKVHTIDKKKKESYTIVLETSQYTLDEVIVNKAINPADEIMKKVILNKKRNNPENLKSFKYSSYNKIIYDYKAIENDKKSERKPRDSHLFIMESVTEKKFVKPDLSQEVVIATKVSGFKNPSFATIATDFQPFSFYDDTIKFFNINYLNPIAKGSLAKYKFRIEETLVHNLDTTYVISFKPKMNKNFDGLQGVLYINKKKFAIQNVIASPAEKGKVDIRIQQKYSIIEDEFWFPEQLNFTIQFNDFPNKTRPMIVDGKAYISQVELNSVGQNEKFTLQKVLLDDHAGSKDPIFWKKHRIEDLNKIDVRTYQRIDSIGSEKKFDSYLTIIEKLIQRRYPLKYIDIDLSKILLYNKYEGLRIGTGFYTNENTSKKITVGGYVGYGTKDEAFKYGGDLSFNLSKDYESKIGLYYKNDLNETGKQDVISKNAEVFDFRKMIGYRYDQVNQAGICLQFRSFKYFLWDFQFQRTKTTPKYDYQFISSDQPIIDYTNSNFKVGLTFAYKEHFISSFHQNISSGTKFPILYLNYSRGLKNFAHADFNYNKIELALEQSVYNRNFGTTTYRAEAGYIDKPLPYGLLFTGEGGYDKDVVFIMKSSFQTLKPYEFLSDKYFNLFLSHNFGGLLFKKDKFQPDIIVHQNLGLGTLSEKAAHNFIAFKTKDKIFIESGLQFNNLIKLNYYNLADIGFGTAAFYRYGYYENPEFKDNIAFKFTLGISIK